MYEGYTTGHKVIKNVIQEDFNPSVVSINNKLEIFAVMPSSAINNKCRERCDLYPVCGITFGTKTKTGIAYVCEGQDHPKSGKSVFS